MMGTRPGLAGSRRVADLRPATRDPGRNQRPAPRDPERPGPGPGLARYTTRDPSRRRPPDARTPGSLTRRDPAWRPGTQPLQPAFLSSPPCG